MNRLIRWLTVFLTASLSSVAPLATAQSSVRLTLGHGAAPGNPRSDAAIRFAELVKERSGGRITILVSGSAQLGDDVTMVSALRSGMLDISINSQGPVSSAVPELSALGLPYLFPTPQKAWELLDGAIGFELARKLESRNLILLGWMDNGIRQITNNTRPITRPDDLKGLTIRTPADPATVDTLRALGAKTQLINFNELYAALQQGLVDGQENPLANIHSARLHEVQKFLSLTNHQYQSTPFVMSGLSWGKLSPDDRRLIKEAAGEATTYQRKLMLETEERLLVEYRNTPSIRINTVNPVPFMNTTRKIRDSWERKPFGEFVKRLRAATE